MTVTVFGRSYFCLVKVCACLAFSACRFCSYDLYLVCCVCAFRVDQTPVSLAHTLVDPMISFRWFAVCVLLAKHKMNETVKLIRKPEWLWPAQGRPCEVAMSLVHLDLHALFAQLGAGSRADSAENQTKSRASQTCKVQSECCDGVTTKPEVTQKNTTINQYVVSSPRDAMSVATNTFFLPSINDWKLASRVWMHTMNTHTTQQTTTFGKTAP